ncbi:hypothetical protein FRC12_004145 [Ceratobasidium sp. 428]|nr:hypothetical protein FRC12_004145 [Ceratobasidium sp. 428]
MNNQGPPPPYAPINEETIRESLRELDRMLHMRTQASTQGDSARVTALDEQIGNAMRSIGQAYPAGENRTYWQNAADGFQAGNAQEKEHILMPIAKGLGIIIATPFALAGGVIFAAGAIVYGVGRVLIGLGDALTAGMFNR